MLRVRATAQPCHRQCGSPLRQRGARRQAPPQAIESGRRRPSASGTTPRSPPGDRNLYLVRIAETQLRTNRIDEADATARAAIEAATGIDSARVQQRVDALLTQFPAGDPRTQQLSDHRAAAHQPHMSADLTSTALPQPPPR